MKVETPSTSRARALARSEVMWRVTPSVPRQPMTVVTPLATMSSTRISGARVAGPPSPPPPRMWTWGSMSPGRTLFPAASTTSASRPSTRIRPGSATAAMAPPARRTSFRPSGSGAKTSPSRIRVIMGFLLEGVRA